MEQSFPSRGGPTLKAQASVQLSLPPPSHLASISGEGRTLQFHLGERPGRTESDDGHVVGKPEMTQTQQTKMSTPSEPDGAISGKGGNGDESKQIYLRIDAYSRHFSAKHQGFPTNWDWIEKQNWDNPWSNPMVPN